MTQTNDPAALQPSSTPAPAPGGGRDLSIQSLRGIVLILMVLYHVSESGPAGGALTAQSSWWNVVMKLLGDVRMPMFAVLSGYVYALRPISSWSQYPNLVRGKFKRLLVPFLVVGTIYFLWQMVGPGDGIKTELSGLPHFWLYADVDPYWFLQAIMWCFLAVGVLDILGWLNPLSRWTAVWVAVTAAYVLLNVQLDDGLLNYGRGLWLFGPFLLGVGFKRFSTPAFERRMLPWAAGGFVVFFALRVVVRYDLLPQLIAVTPQLDRLTKSIVGYLAIFVLFALRKVLENKLLSTIGLYSFGVYILHNWAISFGMGVMPRIGIDNAWIRTAIGLPLAIALPIWVERTFARYPWVSWPIFGQKPNKPTKRKERRQKAGDAATPA
ncbi:MAG: acyltransferase [Arachnia sp.]